MGASGRAMPVLGMLLSMLLATTALARPEHVQYETEDGVVVHATYYPAEGESSSAAVYVHQPGRNRGDWDYIATKLAEKGVAGLAPDLRGHGDSVLTVGGADVDRELFVEADYLKMVHDVAGAVTYLRDERSAGGGSAIQLVGADVGGSAALLYAVEDPTVSTLVLLSPGLMYDGVDTVGQVEAYGKRPLLLVVSVEDSYSAKSTEVLANEALGVSHLQIYYGVGHGTKMLNREPDLEQLLAAWLIGTFKTEGGTTLAETQLKLGAQDKSQGLGGDVDEEQRRRAEEDLAAQEAASSNSDAEVEGGEQPSEGRWD